jgi:tetratricopeptide (TPR) repeat protein
VEAARTWCYAREADGVSLDQQISGCSAEILSGTLPNSDLAIAYSNRGSAYSDKGQLDRAIQDYDQAIMLDPSNAIAHYNRGIAYSAKGQLDPAIRDYDQAIKLDPIQGMSSSMREAGQRLTRYLSARDARPAR